MRNTTAPRGAMTTKADGAWWLDDAARKAETWAEARTLRGAADAANTLREFAAALHGQAALLREQAAARDGGPTHPGRAAPGDALAGESGPLPAAPGEAPATAAPGTEQDFAALLDAYVVALRTPRVLPVMPSDEARHAAARTRVLDAYREVERELIGANAIIHDLERVDGAVAAADEHVERLTRERNELLDALAEMLREGGYSDDVDAVSPAEERALALLTRAGRTP